MINRSNSSLSNSYTFYFGPRKPKPMKRQSAAEIALAKQSKKFHARLVTLDLERDRITAEIDGLKYVIGQLEAEIDSLRTARTAASLRAKPND